MLQFSLSSAFPGEEKLIWIDLLRVKPNYFYSYTSRVLDLVGLWQPSLTMPRHTSNSQSALRCHENPV